MRKKMFKKRLIQSIGIVVLFLVGQSCTDLEVPLQDSVSASTEDGSFGGVVSTVNSLEALYNNIENLNAQNNEYALMEVTADNIAVLTRGADWGDNGVWRQLHNHSWNATQLYVLNSWNNRNSQVLAATQLLDPASGADASITAQAQVIRAINMFMVLNFFGQVPFRGVNEGVDVDPTVLSAQEAFDFILEDLNTAISSGNLHTDGPDGDIFNIGEATARFLRAKVNLNSMSILGSAPAGAMDAVIDDVDAIELLGFTLDDSDGPNGYFDIWDLSAAAGNDEVIMALDVGTGQRVFNMIHPNQTGWNGFVTLTETFRLHGTSDVNDDARLGLAGPDFNGLSTGYLRGQQLNGSGEPLQDRQGTSLVYEDELLTSLEINNERNGIRIVKYPQRGADGFPDPTNNFVWLRFAEALLMRAEAGLRGGEGADPLADVNLIRERAGVATLGSITLEELKDEITKELNSEANIAGNRAVQIRFGTFADTWEMKTVQDEFRNLFPIPATALGSNPNLVQNEGY